MTIIKDKNFGVRIKERRSFFGFSQAKLSKKIGVSVTTIQNYESGSIPNGSYLVLLSQILSCSIDWLLTGIDLIYKDTNFEPNQKNTVSEKKIKIDPVSNSIPDDQPSIAELITKTIEILESKTVYSNALSANIQAFHEATGAEQRFRELQAGMNKMEGRITALETENSKLQEQIKDISEDGGGMVANEG